MKRPPVNGPAIDEEVPMSDRDDTAFPPIGVSDLVAFTNPDPDHRLVWVDLTMPVE